MCVTKTYIFWAFTNYEEETTMRSVAIALASCSEELKFIEFDVVLNDLFLQKIIDHDEQFKYAKKPVKEILFFLQEKLPLKGDTAFPSFIQVLRNRGHVRLADSLDKGGS